VVEMAYADNYFRI